MKYTPNIINMPNFITAHHFQLLKSVEQHGFFYEETLESMRSDSCVGVFRIKYKNK